MISFRKLKADEIETKVKKIGKTGSVWLLYKTARTDMDLLDETVGAENWQSDYKTIKDNLYCGISIKHDGEWIWKWDCGIESREDGEGNEKKGEASDAFKRAGFKWGIGRELYTAPFIFISSDVVHTVEKNGRYSLEDPFLKIKVSCIEYDKKTGDICKLILSDSHGKVLWSHPANAKPTPQVEMITDAQKQLFADLQINTPAILEYLKIDSIDRLTKSQAEQIIQKKLSATSEKIGGTNE